MKKESRIGILGSGQLARMLVEAAQNLNISTSILAERPSDPACVRGAKVTLGSVHSLEDLEVFFTDLDLVVFENEFVDVALLEKAAEGLNLAFAPSLKNIHTLQNKIRQKEVLKKLGIPHSEFRVAPISKDVKDWVKGVWAEFGGDCVFKWAELGYDGKGTCLAATLSEAQVFCEEAASRGISFFCERKIPFDREVALVSSRSSTQEFKSLPIVETEQRNGTCLWVRGPASALKLPAETHEQARASAQKLADHLGLIGTFAIEFFLCGSQLWVNEIAPRVHNSGHFSMDAAKTSQFENHWRGVLGLPLGPTDTTPSFAMLNLLGRRTGEPPKDLFLNLAPHLHFHWYDKTELRPGRKMGHINAVGKEGAALPKLLKELAELETKWNQA